MKLHVTYLWVNIIRETLKKNDGLEKHYKNNQDIYYTWLTKYLIMFPVKGRKRLIVKYKFCEEDDNNLHNYQDINNLSI